MPSIVADGAAGVQYEMTCYGTVLTEIATSTGPPCRALLEVYVAREFKSFTSDSSASASPQHLTLESLPTLSSVMSESPAKKLKADSEEAVVRLSPLKYAGVQSDALLGLSGLRKLCLVVDPVNKLLRKIGIRHYLR